MPKELVRVQVKVLTWRPPNNSCLKRRSFYTSLPGSPRTGRWLWKLHGARDPGSPLSLCLFQSDFLRSASSGSAFGQRQEGRGGAPTFRGRGLAAAHVTSSQPLGLSLVTWPHTASRWKYSLFGKATSLATRQNTIIKEEENQCGGQRAASDTLTRNNQDI